MKLAIVLYNAGNIQSVELALNRLGIEPIITADPLELLSADKVIFPGVGEASSAMKHLKSIGLDLLIPNLRQPVLGVCLGQQLLCSHSEENDTTCLGVFQEKVLRFPPTDKVPHVGWNLLRDISSPLFSNVKEGEYVYFVHSYYVPLGVDTIATTDYIIPFSAALHQNNFYATQFHPEKSGDVGSQILQNFLDL